MKLERNVRSRLEKKSYLVEIVPGFTQQFDVSIALANRLWLMICVGQIGYVLTLGHTHLNLEDGTVQGLIGSTSLLISSRIRA